MKKFLTAKWMLLILVFLFIIFALILTKFNLFSVTEGIAGYILSPVQTFFSESTDKIKDFFGHFNSIEKLRNENKSLKKEVTDLTADKLKLEDDIINSGIILKEYEYITSFNYNTVIAKVISRGSDNYLQSLIINKGFNHGVVIGLPVTSDNGYIIGKIVEVNNYTSKVLLLNDIHSKISANINNEKRSPGIVNGEFGLSLKLTLIPYDHVISDGDIVVTSGLEKNIPANLIIGKIRNFIKNEGELFQSANIDQIINYEDLRILTIILPTDV